MNVKFSCDFFNGGCGISGIFQIIEEEFFNIFIGQEIIIKFDVWKIFRIVIFTADVKNTDKTSIIQMISQIKCSFCKLMIRASFPIKYNSEFIMTKLGLNPY